MPFPSALALSPQGHVYVESRPADESSRQESPDGDGLTSLHLAFGRGTTAGLLALGAMDPARGQSPTWSYWRDFTHQFIARLCALIASGEAVDLTHVSPPPAFFETFASAAPPMTGAEYLSPAVLDGLWTALNQTLLQEAAARAVDVPAYLATLNPAWQLVGRVCFHLAELRDRADTPFAFLATYVQQISSRGRAQHVRLGTAVQQAAGMRDRERLLTLLAPVERAAAEQPFIKSLVESGAVYETLAWTPREAHHFLRAVPALEAAGVTVRVPDWWTPSHPPRVQVQVSVGGKRPSQLGQNALLDFSVRLALDGEPLSAADWNALRRHVDGLAFIKGRWVEIDHAKLAAVLAHWKGVQRAAAQGTLSFSEGLRLLAGAAVAGEGGNGEEAGEEGPEVAAWSHVGAGPWLRKTLQQLRTPETIAAQDDSAMLAAVLRPYQRVGIQWLTLLHALQLGGCLADDMGLGKTIQMLGCWTAIQRRSPGARHLLVVPASLLGNWQAEVARFAPSLRLLVAHPSATPRATLATFSAATLPPADVVITTYGAVPRLPWLAELTWETIVLDEAQAIKNPGTRQARAVKALRSRARFALTGTPIENRLGDLWSLFDFLAPGLLGSARGFSRTVKRLERRPEPRGGDAREASLAYAPLRRLVHPYILRRLKTDPQVIGDLPDKTELRAFCSLTPVQAALYQSSVESLTTELHTREGIARRGLILAFLTRVKQICNHPSHWLGDGRYDPSDSGKFSRLRELCETIATRQEKVLVFTQFRELTEPLADFLAGVFGRSGFVLHGGTPVKRRAAMVDAFQREDGPPFFILSLKAGGTGLTLTAASHVVHFDRWWNPAVENQATDRAYRIGQHRNVLVHKFLCRGTVEERIDALINSKLALSRELLETSGDRLLTELGDDELISLVTLDLKRAVQETA